MASEWTESALGDVVELKRGYDLPQQERRSGRFPIVSSSGISDHHADAKVRGPGVVTGRYSTLGQVFYIAEDFWPLNTTLYVRDFKGNDPRFISYFLRSLNFLAYSDKAAVPGLNRNHLHMARVRFPTGVREQRALAHILGTLDDKIEANRRMNETLEAIARAVFKSWFVDFDPVRARVEDRAPGLAKTLVDLFPDSFADSELGQIPRGWRAAPLPQVIEVNPPRALRGGEVAPYLDMANMPTRGHSPDVVVARPFGSGMRFVNGDTLVARITPCLENGKTAYVDLLPNGQVGWGSTEYMVLRPKAPLPSLFGYCLARSQDFRSFAIQSMTGSSGRQRVPAESLSHFLVVSPAKHIAKLFGRIIDHCSPAQPRRPRRAALSPPCATRCCRSSSPASFASRTRSGSWETWRSAGDKSVLRYHHHDELERSRAAAFPCALRRGPGHHRDPDAASAGRAPGVPRHGVGGRMGLAASGGTAGGAAAGARERAAEPHRAAGVGGEMLSDVVKVEPRGGYRVWLQFQDGVEGEVDLEPRLSFQGVFAPLRDPAYFARVRVNPDLGTISWPNDADWDPLVLYSLVTGRPIETLLTRPGSVGG